MTVLVEEPDNLPILMEPQILWISLALPDKNRSGLQRSKTVAIPMESKVDYSNEGTSMRSEDGEAKRKTKFLNISNLSVKFERPKISNTRND